MACGDYDGLSSGLRWARTFIPGGVRGVLLYLVTFLVEIILTRACDKIIYSDASSHVYNI